MAALRGAGDSRTPFIYLCLSVALDIGLNPLLIFGVGSAAAAWHCRVRGGDADRAGVEPRRR